MTQLFALKPSFGNTAHPAVAGTPGDDTQKPVTAVAKPLKALPPAKDTAVFSASATHSDEAASTAASTAASASQAQPQPEPSPSAPDAQAAKQAQTRPANWKQDTLAISAVMFKTILPTAIGFGAVGSMPLGVGLLVSLASIPACYGLGHLGNALHKNVDASQLSKAGKHAYELGRFGDLDDLLKHPEEADRAVKLYNDVIDDVFKLPVVGMFQGLKTRLRINDPNWLKQLLTDASQTRGMESYYLSKLSLDMAHAKNPLDAGARFMWNMTMLGLFKLSGVLGELMLKTADVMPGGLKFPFKAAGVALKRMNWLPAMLNSAKTMWMAMTGKSGPKTAATQAPNVAGPHQAPNVI
ncbi:MAG: hypothetical protein VKJ06_06395 [Vampirovibrionales bacterium]|nr:hypothetical protein [Vampirovibrionales bacterium]